MFRSILTAAVALSVVGCAPQIESATPTSVSLKYHSGFADVEAVISEANKHCSQYGKVASQTDITNTPRGEYYIRTFRCE